MTTTLDADAPTQADPETFTREKSPTTWIAVGTFFAGVLLTLASVFAIDVSGGKTIPLSEYNTLQHENADLQEEATLLRNRIEELTLLVKNALPSASQAPVPAPAPASKPAAAAAPAPSRTSVIIPQPAPAPAPVPAPPTIVVVPPAPAVNPVPASTLPTRCTIGLLGLCASL